MSCDRAIVRLQFSLSPALSRFIGDSLKRAEFSEKRFEMEIKNRLNSRFAGFPMSSHWEQWEGLLEKNKQAYYCP
jgi:hypothetical protein